MNKRDHILIDESSHNCLQKGAAFATDRISRFKHNDVEHLRERLAEIRAVDPRSAILVVSESIFSMHADGPPINQMNQVAKEFDAHLLIDVAHDLGVLGPRRASRIAADGALHDVDFIMGSFSKTFATTGGFFASKSKAIDRFVRVYGSSAMFSNTLGPLQCATATAALEIVDSSEGDDRRTQVTSFVNSLRSACEAVGLTAWGIPCAFTSIVLGHQDLGRRAIRELDLSGIITNFFEFPAIPLGQSIVRLQATPDHSRFDAKDIAAKIKSAIENVAPAGSSLPYEVVQFQS